MTDSVTGAEIKHSLRRLNVTVAIIGVILIGAVVYVYAHQNQTHDALCTFRADIQARIDQTDVFLKKHPEGFAGLSAATLKQSRDGQARTVTALRPLDCPPPKSRPVRPES